MERKEVRTTSKIPNSNRGPTLPLLHNPSANLPSIFIHSHFQTFTNGFG